jgi:hypothetical protein
MATYSLFISVTDIKQTGFIDSNVDDGAIRVSIWNAQQFYIKPLLGTALFNEVETAVTNNNPTADQTTLLETYIRPVLLWYTHYEGVLPLHIKMRNKGLQTISGDNSQPVGMREIFDMMNYFKDRAEEFAERLKNYLIENAVAKFPSYLNAGSGADTIHPNKITYDMGWYLGGSVKCDPIDRYENPGECC